MRRDRWVAVGRSAAADARAAGAEAAAGALQGDDPVLLIVFCSDAYDKAAVLAGIHDQAGEVALIGCSTAGEIASRGPGDANLVVTALGGPGFSVSTAATSGVGTDLRHAGTESASPLWKVDRREHQVLLMLTDGLAGDQQEIVRGAYSVAGATVPLVGGCAGDDLRMVATTQLHGNDVLRDSIVSAAISSDSPIGIGVRHGWQRVGAPMFVTASAGNRVYAIDDQPALDVYLERLDAPADARHDPAAFTAFALTHPLGIDRGIGEEQVRFVGEADFDERALVCIARVPQGGLTWFMEGDELSVLAATDDACADALASLHGRDPIGLLAFDCIARRGVLGEGVEAEVQRIAGHAQGAPVAGFYTYGEIARTQGVSGFHNQTLVVLALA